MFELSLAVVLVELAVVLVELAVVLVYFGGCSSGCSSDGCNRVPTLFP